MRDGEQVGRRPRSLRGVRAVCVAAAILALALAVIPLKALPSEAAFVPANINLTPTSGFVGTTVTVTQGGLWPTWVLPTTGQANPCVMSWLWNGTPWTTTGTGGTGQAGQSGHQASAVVPSFATVGANTITAVCSNPETNTPLARPTAIFTVNPAVWTLTDSPASAVAGSSPSVLLTGSNSVPGNPGCALTYSFDGSAITKQGQPYHFTVPASTAAGAHTFKISCATSPLNGSATVGFTVTPRPTTTTTRGTTTTTRGSNSTTTAKGATTTTAKGSTTTSGGSSTTGSPTSVSIDTTPTTVPGQAPVTATTYLRLTALAIAPGSAVAANGRGCDADAPVTLTVDSAAVGHTRASGSGAFHAPLTLGPLGVGRYTVVARCGVILAAPLDIVLASRVSAATSTLAIIIFVLLIGALAFRRQIFPRRPRSRLPAPSSETESPT
jgi:hypothetical protein